MKFLNTEVWRLNSPVDLSAQDRMPVVLSIAAAGDDVATKDLVRGFGKNWG